ncbi:hypothetical protein [Tabrizicola sp.]|uniref:hypothetical protein n=1 Tax=Tabrizicola sp. TaxID=2005166 RepID=UPI003D268711
MAELVATVIESELKLASYYTGLRDKIATLNVAIVGFSFSLYDKVVSHEKSYFFFLLGIGIFSLFAATRAGIAYNYHFRNYEDLVRSDAGTNAIDDLMKSNRGKYRAQKTRNAWYTLGTTLIPTHVFWSLSIGLICPMVAITAFWPFES